MRNGAFRASINLITGGLLPGSVFKTQCVNRMKKVLYNPRANGKSKRPTKAGEGGQLTHGFGATSDVNIVDDDLQRSKRTRSRVATGVEVGQARRTGTNGTTAEGRGARERIKEMGIRGRLRKACHGHSEMSCVRRRLYILKEITEYLVEHPKNCDALLAKELIQSKCTICSAETVYACKKMSGQRLKCITRHTRSERNNHG
jgi:hypothetical protein